MGPVIANAFCNFIRQLEYPGDVIVHTYVGAVGRSSFDPYHDKRRSDQPDVVSANGGATVMWVDFAAQRSVPVPESLRQWLM